MHNARGMAMLSAYEALKTLGPDDTLMLDTAVGGIGGCPYCGNGQATGMIPTEDLVQLLQVEGVETGIDLGKLIEAAKTLEDILQRPLDGRVAKNGALPSPARFTTRTCRPSIRWMRPSISAKGPACTRAIRGRGCAPRSSAPALLLEQSGGLQRFRNHRADVDATCGGPPNFGVDASVVSRSST